MQSKSWDIDEVNSVDFSKLEIGSINASVAQSIGITDATDFFQVIRIPWSSPYPNQILLTLSGKQRMYYRACSNGTWETPKRLITNADLQAGLISFNNMSNGQVYSKEVTFPKTFSSTPYVAVSPVSSTAGTIFTTVGARSASKVTINGRRNDSSGVLDVLWIAVAM